VTVPRVKTPLPLWKSAESHAPKTARPDDIGCDRTWNNILYASYYNTCVNHKRILLYSAICSGCIIIYVCARACVYIRTHCGKLRATIGVGIILCTHTHTHTHTYIYICIIYYMKLYLWSQPVRLFPRRYASTAAILQEGGGDGCRWGTPYSSMCIRVCLCVRACVYTSWYYNVIIHATIPFSTCPTAPYRDNRNGTHRIYRYIIIYTHKNTPLRFCVPLFACSPSIRECETTSTFSVNYIRY
jgi:hypothetical protein